MAATLQRRLTMRKPKLIALDLDGTLLTSDKKLATGDREALKKAAAAGIEIVPTTGRFYGMMPEVIRSLTFVHYVITVNGAAVMDLTRNRTVYKAELPLAKALEIMTYLDTLPVIYDCYMGNRGWMTAGQQAKASQFAPDEHYLKLLLEQRQPVPELKAFLRERGTDVQKILLFTDGPELQKRLLSELEQRFPGTVVTSSTRNNVEINEEHATKGEALKGLAKGLGFDVSETLAFGDGLNDLSLIRTAGIGVAMKNAEPEILEAADYITASNDDCGVAAGIERFCF